MYKSQASVVVPMPDFYQLREENMTGKFIGYVLSVLTFFYIVLISISFFLHMTVNERVNDICYDAAETISTRRKINEEIFAYIKGNLSCYGEYNLNIILEKLDNEKETHYYFGEEQILGKELSCGDRVIIYASEENPSLFEKLTGTDMDISTVKVAIIN